MHASPALITVVLLPVLGSPALADVLHLRDGGELRGRVVDLGGNSIELHQTGQGQTGQGQSRHIFLKDIKKATFDLSGQPLARDADLVFRKNGSELSGEVALSEDGKSVVVSQKDGSQVTIPRHEAARIVYRDGGRGVDESAAVYSASVRDEIRASLVGLEKGGEPAQAGEERLKAYGIFAIADAEEARRAAREGSPARRALDRVVRHYRLRELSSDALEGLVDYYQILDGGDLDQKRGLLEEMFTRFVDDSVPVAKLLVRDGGEDPAVRAWAVDLLGRMQRNRDLVDIFNDPSGGKVQLAAAIALARNRILAGGEALIEALEMDEPGVRELAHRALKDAVGKDFGFGAHDTPSARKDAIARFKKWWAENRTQIQAQTASILSGASQPGDTPERRKALELWKRGSIDWERGKFAEAETALRSSVRTDPTFFNAQASLGVLLYVHRKKGEEGRRLLEDLLTKRLPEMKTGDATWIHYYLGNAWEAAGDLERADLEYRRSVGIDPGFFRAAAALGDLKFRRATAAEGLKVEERRRFLREAEAQYQAAITLIESHNVGLETLSLSDLPVETAPAFERQAHNRGILDVKASLRKRKSEMHFGLAKIRSLLDDIPRALGDLTSAIETLGDDREGGARELLVDLHNYRAFLLEEAGETSQALRDYRSVVKDDLEPGNATALLGIRRLKAKATAAPDREPGEPPSRRATQAETRRPRRKS